MSETEENKKYRPLTDDLVREALRSHKGETPQLVSWTCEDFTKKGDNYASFVTSVKVEYKENDEGEPRQVSYVAKIAHQQMPEAMRDLMNEVFRKEGAIFLEIMPALNETLKELRMEALRTAKGYSASYTPGKEVLLLEDLRQRHFKMFDRRRGMDVPHASLVLKELARLHAGSLLLEKRLRCTLTEKWPVLIDKWLEEEAIETTEMFQKMIESQMEASALIMDKTPKYEHVVNWIRKNKANGMDIFRKAFGLGGKFTALTHGDCWNNNILFRYDECGGPVEVMLVDLQCLRRASVATDLSYFLYSSFNGDVRKNNLDVFIDIYYDSFIDVLREAQQLSPPFSREELRQEFMTKLTFGCVSGMILAPIVLSEEEDVMNWFDNNENMDQMNRERQEATVRMASREDGNLKDRYLHMFDDLVEAGIISVS